MLFQQIFWHSCYGWVAKQIPAILFYRSIYNYCCLFPFFEWLGQWILQTVIDNHKIPTDLQSGIWGTIQVNLVSPKLCYLYLSRVKWKTHSQFSQKLFNQFKNCLWILIKLLKFYKSVRHEQTLLHNLVSIYQVENVSPEKQKKMLNISYSIQPIFIKFLPNWLDCVWPSNAPNRWPWKCCTM